MPKSKNTVNKNKNGTKIAQEKVQEEEEEEDDDDLEPYESCGNVYKDLGFSDDEAANLLVRSQLMLIIRETIRQRGWTQKESAAELGVHQPRVSDLFQGRIGHFSVDTLMSWLYKLGKDVTINVKDRNQS